MVAEATEQARRAGGRRLRSVLPEDEHIAEDERASCDSLCAAPLRHRLRYIVGGVPEADPQSVTSAARGSSPEVAPHKLRLSHALARLLFR